MLNLIQVRLVEEKRVHSVAIFNEQLFDCQETMLRDYSHDEQLLRSFLAFYLSLDYNAVEHFAGQLACFVQQAQVLAEYTQSAETASLIFRIFAAMAPTSTLRDGIQVAAIV